MHPNAGRSIDEGGSGLSVSKCPSTPLDQRTAVSFGELHRFVEKR